MTQYTVIINMFSVTQCDQVCVRKQCNVICIILELCSTHICILLWDMVRDMYSLKI